MKSRLQTLLHRITEPQILFPLSAVVTLLLVWGGTLSYIRMERAEMEARAVGVTQQVLETYEAQMIRALGEIDHAMRLVSWWREQGADRRIRSLGERQLLPPELVFEVSVVDAQGRIIDSNRSGAQPGIADADYFAALRSGAADVVSLPFTVPGGTEPHLRFGRRLASAAGDFTGAVIVDVDAEYFVSGYEEATLGQHGLLALIGTDGAMRVQRTGDSIDAAGSVPSSLATGTDADDGIARRTHARMGRDGSARWIAGRELFGFPLSVMVGLSVDEQFKAFSERTRRYFALAGIISLISVIALAVLGRLSWQLSRSRQRELAARKAHAERVEFLAYHDGLTGLANRSLFSKLLSQLLQEGARYEQQLALVYLDLDGFKAINDTLGHEAGDELLQEIARRLQGCVRGSDTVARLGGDEFVVLLPQVLGDADVSGVAEKILAAVARPMQVRGREVRVTASIGIALCPRDGRDEQTLKLNADQAMYQTKSAGKNNYRFYTEHLSGTSLLRLNLEANLRYALERDEFRLFYQAKRDLATGRVNGMEALLRWEHPELGIVPPMQFLPLAEETGVIIAIGRWVLRTACEQSLALQQRGLPALCVAVNLTARQLYDEQLLHDVRTTLAQTGLEPWLLELEIPESALSHRAEYTRKLLLDLKEIGVRIAIGDFGMGYALLGKLGDFAFDTIKIDRALTRAITEPPQDAALADAVIAMGRRLSATVVAQGVETSEQAQFLRAHRCDELQGYYVGTPVPAAEFAIALHEQAALAEAAAAPAPGHWQAL
ncbi:MAG: EAL domain-containing protein [Steroidobacteraceae bacterium]